MAAARTTVSAELGARVLDHGVRYRVWAPQAPAVKISITGCSGTRIVQLEKEDPGFWSATDPKGAAGDRYLVGLGDSPPIPDIASRFQPDGVDGPSECVSSNDYEWQSSAWNRPQWTGQSIYEVHIGTMTAEGTFHQAATKLHLIRDLGIQAIEIMPIADFAGDRNWGYDGVALFAPARCYGRPDDLRALVDKAHACGLAVLLDLVYNHVGPQGNYFRNYSPSFFKPDHDTPWGPAFNLDDEGSMPVREFLISNVAYWLDEFRIDGLRLDATHAIPDRSEKHIIAEITELTHSRGGFVIAEDERNSTMLIESSDQGGYGIDAVWADDFHHQVRVALTGERKSYFTAYSGSIADLGETLTNGWSYRGQSYSPWQGRPRGTECRHILPASFVFCIENHDQIGNRRNGERLEHTIGAPEFRAASMLLCLSPYAPLIFMGQEWAASSPFLFFSNHQGDLGRAIWEGRKREFAAEHDPDDKQQLKDPEDRDTFLQSKLLWDERSFEPHSSTLRFYSACLRARREALSPDELKRSMWDVSVETGIIGIRYRLQSGEKMLLVSLQGCALPAERLRASFPAPKGCHWRVIIDSNHTSFGGADRAPEDWDFSGAGALWLEAINKDTHAIE